MKQSFQNKTRCRLINQKQGGLDSKVAHLCKLGRFWIQQVNSTGSSFWADWNWVSEFTGVFFFFFCTCTQTSAGQRSTRGKQKHLSIKRRDWQAGKINSRGSQMWTWGTSTLISFTCSSAASNRPEQKNWKKQERTPTVGIKTALVYPHSLRRQGLALPSIHPPPIRSTDVNIKRRAQTHTHTHTRTCAQIHTRSLKLRKKMNEADRATEKSER